MKTLKLFICLMLSATVLAFPAVASAQGRWWQSERFQKELALTPEQITAVGDALAALREGTGTRWDR